MINLSAVSVLNLGNYTCRSVFVQVFMGAPPKSCYSAQDSGYLPYVFKGIVLASAKKQQYIFDEFLCIGERQVRASQGLRVLGFLHEVCREMMAPIVAITLMKSS